MSKILFSRNANKKDMIINISIFLIVSIINLLLILNHEMWEDEAQAWLIARDCTPVSVFNVTSYEGHPALWYFILMPFAKLNFPGDTLYYISYSIMELTLFVVLFFSPFDPLLRAVVSFSPMFIYTFSAISRCYCLIALFIVCIASVYYERNKKPILFGTLIALLVQTHIIMLGMAFVLCVVWLCETLCSRKSNIISFKKNIVALLLPFLSALFLLFELRNVFNADYDASGAVLSNSTQKPLLIGIIIVLFLLTQIVLFRIIRNKSIYKLLLITSFSLLYQLVFYTFFYGYNTSRLIVCLYILLFFIWNFQIILGKSSTRVYSIISTVFLIFLSAIFISSVYLRAAKDVVIPYTDSKNVAVFINEEIEPSAKIAVNSYEECIDVVPYLNNRSLFDPFTNHDLTYINREKGATKKWLSKDEFINALESKRGEKEYVYILVSSISKVEGIDEIIKKSDIVYDSSNTETILDETFMVIKYYY